ncbi:PREDICTED: circadian-associated transcriptional repressor [Thamnophis sirtalis]|uniref:Circadian-associated transcriptional repressor n=1 Tax=Thamnophis sirtalis TaxID=35019 RepID=A0A6I9Y272_9SAUR|nr:PREDICTED: circadian-associated transcriptional repressor [Thamnophis sirtalis]
MDKRSFSSRESFHSVESATSEEEEGEEEQLLSPKGKFRIFLLDDGKEAKLPRHRCLQGSGFLLLPGLPGQGPKRPLGLQPPGSACLHGPEGPKETLCSRRVSPNGSLPGQRVKRKRAEGSGGCTRQSSATGGSRPPPCPTASVPSPGIKRPRRKEALAAEETPRWSSSGTEGDQAFAQKCWELQGFVRPLSELLNRLKMGCFDQGLSSFQQSVAMDRIQRIIGVLQKPQMGGRYLGILLQVEKMLKIWFPHVPLKDSQASYSVSARGPCGAAKSRCVEEQITGSRSASIQDDMLKPFSDVSSLEDHDVGTRQGEPVPMGNGPALNLSWIHTLPLNPLLGQVDFNQINSVLGQILLGPNASNCGVVFFLQKVMFTQAASKTLEHGCPPGMLFSGSGEPPRCQSLPGVLTASCSAPSLGRLSLLLPHLSGEKLERSEASVGKPVKCCSS